MRGAYGSPSGQVSGRVEIGVGLVSTPETGELRLTPAVTFIDMATRRTGPAGIARIDEQHGDAYTLRLVVDKRLQLAEAPTRMPVALTFANRRPTADVGQFFQYQRSLRVFGMGHKPFRDRMIHAATEAGFLPGQLFEPTLRRFRVGCLIGF